MKRCPTCSRVYDDVSLRFCLDDGTELVNKPSEPAPPTLAMPGSPENEQTISTFQPPPPPPPPAFAAKKKRSVLPWVIGAGALLLALVGGAIAGVLLLYPRNPLVTHLVLEVDQSAPNRDAAVTQSVAVIESRLDALGVSNFQVKAGEPGMGHLLVDLPALKDPERIKKVISDWGKLELVHVIGSTNPEPAQTYLTEAEARTALDTSGSSNRRILPYVDRDDSFTDVPKQKKWVIVETPAIIDGSSIRNASAIRRTGEDYEIQFSLNKSGAEKFGAWTGTNINQYLGVVLNDEVRSIPYIKSQIFDTGEISGRYTKESAEDLALILRAGALPARLRFIEETIDKH